MNNNIKNKIQELFVEKSSEVLSSFPSLYSKDDVHTVITKLHTALETLLEGELANGLVDDSVEPKYTLSQFKQAIDNIDINDYSDYDSYSAEFSLNGNEIELDRVDVTINTRDLISVLEDELKEVTQTQQ
jgi:hypothetical protein